jgi:hypothetical protein
MLAAKNTQIHFYDGTPLPHEDSLSEGGNLSVMAYAMPPPLKRGGFRWGFAEIHKSIQTRLSLTSESPKIDLRWKNDILDKSLLSCYNESNHQLQGMCNS